MQIKTPVDALLEAVTRAGGQAALAKQISAISPKPISQANVWNWLRRDMRAPAEVCPLIERLTQVACENLRPDVDWAYLRNTANTAPAPTAAHTQEPGHA